MRLEHHENAILVFPKAAKVCEWLAAIPTSHTPKQSCCANSRCTSIQTLALFEPECFRLTISGPHPPIPVFQGGNANGESATQPGYGKFGIKPKHEIAGELLDSYLEQQHDYGYNHT